MFDLIVNEIDARGLQAKLESGEQLRLIDIRSEAEVMHGVLPQSEHLPMHLIPLRLSEFPKDQDLVLYCRSGARSYHACAYLAQQGFQNVFNLRGGIIDWARNGYRVNPQLDS
jgi:rhodanese-related sulfurtransferase